MNLLHEQLIDILTVLDVVCTKSRLRWYLTGGRLLGPLETVNSYVDFSTSLYICSLRPGFPSRSAGCSFPKLVLLFYLLALLIRTDGNTLIIGI